jgi:hypothetical protein
MYKVVTEKMESLGLRKNPNIIWYRMGEWFVDPIMFPDNRNDGGIWCCEKLSAARALKRYYEKRYGKARIFECEIGIILYKNSYRTKTDRIKLIQEIL